MFLRHLNKKGQSRGNDKNLSDVLKKHFGSSSEEGGFFSGFFSGIPGFSWLFRKLGKILKFLAQGFWAIFFVLALIVIVYFLFTYFFVAKQGEVLSKRVGVGVEETGAPLLAELGLVSVYDAIFRPERLYSAYSFESDVQKNKDNKNLGVKINSLEQEGGRVYSGQPIIVRGSITAQSLDKPFSAIVDCNLEDYEGTPEVSIPTSDQGNKFQVYENVVQTYNIGCFFKNGISIEEEVKLLTLEGYREILPRVAKTAEMSISYKFNTKSIHTIWLLTRNLALLHLSRNEDPFKVYQKSEPNLNSDKTIRSVATVGPINLGIGTYDSQPFFEGSPHFFGISLNNNLGYNGYLKKLNRLDISLPSYMAVPGESEFGDGGSCDFYYIGTNRDGFKVYTLKDEKMDFVNNLCSEEDLKIRNTLFSDCVEIYKDSFDFLCQFKIVEQIPDGDMWKDNIWAEADYIYETSRKVVVDIIPSPELKSQVEV